MNIRRLVVASIATASLLSINAPYAASPQGSGTLLVTTNVVGNCNVSPNNTLAFPAYNTSNPAATLGTGTFSVTCTGFGTNPVTVGLDSGLQPGSSGARQMKNSATPDLLTYHLYQTATATTEWDNSTNMASYTVASGVQQNFTVYGSIDPLQGVTAGSYSDTVTITAYF